MTATRFKGRDRLDQYQFDFCCTPFSEMLKNYHGRVYGYDIETDQFYIHEACTNAYKESIGNHHIHFIPVCPYCGIKFGQKTV